MDIIAYGAASQEKRRAKELADSLGPDVEGTSDTLQERIDLLMESMDDVTRLADRVIVRDAVNLMKAEARLNTLIQAKKYGMEHMFFDDLLDLSGIDTQESAGYVHDAIKGEIDGGEITTKQISAQSMEKVVLVIDEKSTSYSQDLLDGSVKVSASSSNYSDISSVFNNKTDDGYWFGSATTSDWLQVDFGLNNERKIERITLQAPHSNIPGVGLAKQWDLEASNDRVAWEKISSVSNEPQWGLYEKRQYDFNNNTRYRYYRITNMVNFGYSYHTFGELEMMEKLESTGYKGTYTLSVEGDEEPVALPPGELVQLKGKSDKRLRVHMNIPIGTKLLNYGLIWT